MRLRLSLLTRAVMAVTLATGAAACDDPTPTSPIVDTPVAEMVTATYAGTLARNGAFTFPFSVSSAGNVTANLTTIGPDNTVAVGIVMGTWNGAQCATVIANDNATESSQMVGAAGSAGTLCLRIYDVGRLSEPITFTMAVTYPGA